MVPVWNSASVRSPSPRQLLGTVSLTMSEAHKNLTNLNSVWKPICLYSHITQSQLSCHERRCHLSVRRPCNVYWHVTAPYKLSFYYYYYLLFSVCKNLQTWRGIASILHGMTSIKCWYSTKKLILICMLILSSLVRCMCVITAKDLHCMSISNVTSKNGSRDQYWCDAWWWTEETRVMIARSGCAASVSRR